MTRAETGTEPRTATAAAKQFLQAALAGGPAPATEVSHMAHEHGLTARAIRRAREALAVRIARVGFGPGSRSVWALPRLEAHPPPSQEGGSASQKEPAISETHQPTVAGYEVIGLSDEPCTYCGKCGGPVHPMQAQSGPVYLMQGLFKGVSREPLHETCAGYWRDFYRALAAKRGGQA
jgi:hypothetical protein